MRLLSRHLQRLCLLRTSHRLFQIKPSYFHTKSRLVYIIQKSTDPTSTKSIHCVLLKCGHIQDTVAANHLQNSYIRAGEVSHARQLFDEMPEPNLVSRTSLISGFVKDGRPGEGLGIYGMMRSEMCVVPNEFTLSIVINACSALADLRIGKIVHAQVEVFGLGTENVVCCALIDMYGKCNDMESARRVFNKMSFRSRSVVAWGAMISSYGQNGQGHMALELLREFNWFGNERLNQFILASVVNACSSLGRLASGKVCHGVAIRCGYDANVVVANAVLDMYAKCGCVAYAEKVFRRIQNPSVFSYTSIIVGSGKYGHGLALELFKEMLEKGIKPNDVTFVGVLHACSHSGRIDDGFQYLNTMQKMHGVVPDSRHQICVVDMLGRAGRLDEAYRLARSTNLTVEQGAHLWGTLLSASTLHKRVDIATEASKWLIASEQQVAAAYVTMSNTLAMAGNYDSVCKIRAEMKHNGISKEPGCSWVEMQK